MTNVKQVVALTVFLLSAVAYSADFNVRDFGALLSRRVCEEGFVLLKNENAALPLAKGAKVAVFAPAYGQWLAGSGVSALVKSPYVVDLPEGLANAGFDVDPDSRETAVFVISRECGRGKEPDLGAYELKDEETAELARIKSLGFKRIVVVLNCGVFVATRDLAADPAVSAILYVGLPAMEGGNATANVLSGAVNPSGRLTQTLPGAAEKVVYPFGHGLSYTTWKVEPEKCMRHGDIVKMACFAPVVNSRGAIFVHPKGIVKRTTYHEFWMYANLAEPNVVPVTLKCADLSDGKKSLPVLDAVMTQSDDGKSRVLMVVNKSPDEAVSLDLSASCPRGLDSVSATILSGDSPDAYNDIGSENRVVPQKTRSW